MQAIFYPATPHFVHKGTTFSIFAQHDEYSLWFEMCPLERFQGNILFLFKLLLYLMVHCFLLVTCALTYAH